MNARDERHEFEISIDGEEYTLTQKEMPATEILSLAGKSYDAFYLVEMRADHTRAEYKDGSAVVKLHNGLKFITVHVGPTPVS
ncbi:MAG: hypothetical protein D9V44_09440 [Actinobacteria bacterium]|nr:MAG: hypothetical protein D9V44_09440 [Actinomycetota bacterium]